MPLTPLHLGHGLFLGAFTLRVFNLWALLFGSVIMDVEPFFLLIINPCYSCPHHGFFHSILGAIFGSLIIAAILWVFRKKLNEISLKFKIRQSFSFSVLFFSSLFSWLIHISLDSLTHFDVFPFWPSHFKLIFIGRKIYWLLNLILLISGTIGFIIIYRNLKNNVERQRTFTKETNPKYHN